jgi:surfeit locus 1 family protein
MPMALHPAHPAPARRLRLAVLAAVGIALFLGLVALGTWQLERRAWKLALIERVEQRVHAAPRPAPLQSEWAGVNAADHEYLPVQLRGRWVAGKTVLTQAVTELGAGFWVVTPLQQDDGTLVLVNRGFVPGDQRERWLAPPASPAAQADVSTVVQGLLRMTEPGGGFLRDNAPAQQRWYSRDVAAIGQSLQLSPLAPYFVDAGLASARLAIVAEGSAASAANAQWPQPGLTVVRFHNSHLVYALTWYGLALMVAGAAWYVARYERRRHGALHRRAAPPAPP